MFNIEGLGRQLYPDLDIWKTASPILREWMREKNHPANVARRLWKQMPELLDALEASPVALRQKVVAAARPQPSWSPYAADAHRSHAAGDATPCRGRDHSIAAGLVLLAGAIWVAARTDPEWLGWTMGVAGALWLVREIWKRP
jgi:ubiquinone biosynthesis protein